MNVSFPSYRILLNFQTIRPYHIYNLAGESFVADSFKYPGVALEVNTIGTLNILTARLILPDYDYSLPQVPKYLVGHGNYCMS